MWSRARNGWCWCNCQKASNCRAASSERWQDDLSSFETGVCGAIQGRLASSQSAAHHDHFGVRTWRTAVKTLGP